MSASFAAYGAVSPTPAAHVVEGSGLTVESVEAKQRSRKAFIAVLVSVTALALLVGHHGHAPASAAREGAWGLLAEHPTETRKPNLLQAAKKHGQAAKAQLATGPAKHMSLDEMDKNGGMGVRVVESIEDAINTPPTKDNSHYYSNHTDRIVHLTVIMFVLLVTLTIFCWCGRQRDMTV